MSASAAYLQLDEQAIPPRISQTPLIWTSNSAGSHRVNLHVKRTDIAKSD